MIVTSCCARRSTTLSDAKAVQAMLVLGVVLFVPGTAGIEVLAGGPANETHLNLAVASGGNAAVLVAPGELVPYDVTGVLDRFDNEGLSVFMFDLSFSGGPLSPVDTPVAGPLTAFVAPAGFNNPEGFGGAVIAGVLREVGGAQNTLKAAGPPPLASGAVVTGVGHSPIVLASGVLTAPSTPGDYTLSVSNVTARAILEGQDGSGAIWATGWVWPGAISNLSITVRPCEEACADADADGIRDDACVWYGCQGGVTCQAIDVPYGDLGGAFGACAPDGFANLFDRSHVLTCFAGTNPCPSINIDAGGPFGNCAPEGFCNIFDVVHVLTSFAGTNPCTCPGAAMPEHEPVVAGEAELVLVASVMDGVSPVPAETVPQHRSESGQPASAGANAGKSQRFPERPPGREPDTREPRVGERAAVQPDGIVRVDVYLQRTAQDREPPTVPHKPLSIQGYQVHLGVSGGSRGRLELADVHIEQRKDFLFAGQPDKYQASNIRAGQMLCGLTTGAEFVPGSGRAYLATFTYRASADAAGTFVVDVLCDEAAGEQTFVLGPQAEQLVVAVHRSAVVTVPDAAAIAPAVQPSAVPAVLISR